MRIQELIKNSEGCINIDSAEELECFEFMFYYNIFRKEYEEKMEIQAKEKQDMNNLIVEGITNLYKALRG